MMWAVSLVTVGALYVALSARDAGHPGLWSWLVGIGIGAVVALVVACVVWVSEEWEELKDRWGRR